MRQWEQSLHVYIYIYLFLSFVFRPVHRQLCLDEQHLRSTFKEPKGIRTRDRPEYKSKQLSSRASESTFERPSGWFDEVNFFNCNADQLVGLILTWKSWCIGSSPVNPFATRMSAEVRSDLVSTLSVNGREYLFYDVATFGDEYRRLPYCLRVLVWYWCYPGIICYHFYRYSCVQQVLLAILRHKIVS